MRTNSVFQEILSGLRCSKLKLKTHTYRMVEYYYSICDSFCNTDIWQNC